MRPFPSCCLRFPLYRMALQGVALSRTVRVVLLSSHWHLGKVFSPGTEGSRAPSTQTCLSSTDEGLRVYTTNTAILNAEREGNSHQWAQPCLLKSFYTDPPKCGFKGGSEGNHIIFDHVIFPRTSKISQDSSEQLTLALPGQQNRER